MMRPAFWYGVLALGASACSIVLDTSATQCSVDGDCGFLGSSYVCDAGVCREDDSAEGTTTGPLMPGSSGDSTSSGAVTTNAEDESSSDGGSTGTTGEPSVCPSVDRYSWSDSIAPVRNACELPGLLGRVLDDETNEAEVAAPLESLPFDICLYGELATQLWIGDNGYVAVGDGPPGALQADVGTAHSLGEPGVPGPGIVPFWDSLQPSADGVCVAVEGNEPNRTLWITWSESCFEELSGSCEGGASSLTFSVGFEEATGSIIAGYVSMTGDGALEERAMGQTAVTGITNAGPRNCPASECDADGMCGDGQPCNYTEVGALMIRPLDTVQFDPAD